jgi:hypothetical protein
MGESAIAQSAPSAAGALGGLLAVQIRRVAVRLPRLAPVRGPVSAPPKDERHEHACRLLVISARQAEWRAAKRRDRLSQAVGESGPDGGQHPRRYPSAEDG